MDVKIPNRFTAASVLLGLIWLVSLLELSGISPELFPKLFPRNFSALPGVLSMPFLHGDLVHLLSNTITFLVFAVLISLSGNKHFIKVTISIILLSGLAVWLFARSAYHIGASGMIFGYFGFLTMRMFYSPKIGTIIISILVIVLYGSMIWGVLPKGPHISWEAHLFGFLSGIIVAKMMKDEETA